MSRKKPQRKRRGVPKPAPAPLDPDTGLPPVGKGLPGEAERVVGRARAKHAHKQHGR